MKTKALTMRDLGEFNDRQPWKLLCWLTGHKFGGVLHSRVADQKGKHVCVLQTCARCKRFKVAQVVQRKLNRKARRL